jgi:hypothetical protein
MLKKEHIRRSEKRKVQEVRGSNSTPKLREGNG